MICDRLPQTCKKELQVMEEKSTVMDQGHRVGQRGHNAFVPVQLVLGVGIAFSRCFCCPCLSSPRA